jgi:hypothetical protein
VKRQQDEQKRRSIQVQRRIGGGTAMGDHKGQDRLLDELNVKFGEAMNGSGCNSGMKSAMKSSKLGDGQVLITILCTYI